jgi:amphiphysin
MNSFADEAKYDISNVPATQIVQEYEEKRTDAWSVIENLSIVKRIVSVCKFNDYVPYTFCSRGSFL